MRRKWRHSNEHHWANLVRSRAPPSQTACLKKQRKATLKPTCNLLLYNGVIHTMDPKLPLAEAVAITGSRIVAVGRTQDLSSFLRSSLQAVDLEGRLMVPGFIDSHFHMIDTALLKQGIDLSASRSLQEALSCVEGHASRSVGGCWITGWGWDESAWQENCLPTKDHLDTICPTKPVFLRRMDGHSAWLNSIALEKLGITRDTTDPRGGMIARDPVTRDPTGILYDAAVFESQKEIPLPDAVTLRSLIKDVIEDCMRVGLTGLHDATWDGRTFRATLEAYQALRSRGELQARVLIMLPGDGMDEIIKLGFRSGFGDNKLRLGGIKLFADGSLCSRTALLSEPYGGSVDYCGLEVARKEDLRRLLGKSLRLGISAAVHAIGDRAISEMIGMFSELAEDVTIQAVPVRIEHASLLPSGLREQTANLGLVITAQPLHIAGDMKIAEACLGDRRCRNLYAFRDNLDAGIKVAFGSDSPVAEMDPLKGIYAAIARQDLSGDPDGGWYPEQRITVNEAVWCYTMGSAIASGEVDRKGSITPGKLADAVVLSEDIFQVCPQESINAKVDFTIFNGKIAYNRTV